MQVRQGSFFERGHARSGIHVMGAEQAVKEGEAVWSFVEGRE